MVDRLSSGVLASTDLDGSPDGRSCESARRNRAKRSFSCEWSTDIRNREMTLRQWLSMAIHPRANATLSCESKQISFAQPIYDGQYTDTELVPIGATQPSVSSIPWSAYLELVGLDLHTIDPRSK